MVQRTFGLDFSVLVAKTVFQTQVPHVKAKASPSLLVIKHESPPQSCEFWHGFIKVPSISGVRSLTC